MHILRIRLEYGPLPADEKTFGIWNTPGVVTSAQDMVLPDDPNFSANLLKSEARFGLNLALQTLIVEIERNA